MPDVPARRSRLTVKKKLVLSALTSALVLLSLEGAVRVREKYLYGTFRRAGTTLFVPPATLAQAPPKTDPNVGKAHDPTVAPTGSATPAVVASATGPWSDLADPLVLTPGDVSGSRFQVHVNELRFRGREVVVPKPAGVKRIACVGGSTTFDIYAERDDLTWPALMEARLRAKHANVEVVNAGAGGRQLKHSLHAINWEPTARLQPDIVFVYHATNEITDACHKLPTTSKTGARTIGSPGGKALKAITDWSLFAYKVWLLATSFSKPPEVEGPDDLDVPESARADFERCLREIVARSKGLGAKVALGTFALRWRHDVPEPERRKLAEGAFTTYPGLSLNGIDRAFARYNETIVRVARETDCLLVPVADRLSGEPRYFGDVMHTTREGSQKFAEVVGDALEQAHWLD